MPGEQEPFDKYRRWFDRAMGFGPAVEVDESLGAAGVLSQMVRFPASWQAALEELKRPEAWAVSGELTGELPETMALGLMLAMNAGEISVQGESSRQAAGYWYRSALLLETSGPLPAPLLEYAVEVLGTVARDSAGHDQELAFAQAVESAFEQARTALASQGKSMPRPCVDRHAMVLRELVWPRLTQAEPGDAWRVVLSAWTATGRESLVCQWAAKSLASGKAGLALVAEDLGVDGFAAWLARMFCEFGVRLGVPAWLELGREARRLMNEPAFEPGTCNRVELLQSMVELLHQARMVTR